MVDICDDRFAIVAFGGKEKVCGVPWWVNVILRLGSAESEF